MRIHALFALFAVSMLAACGQSSEGFAPNDTLVVTPSDGGITINVPPAQVTVNVPEQPPVNVTVTPVVNPNVNVTVEGPPTPTQFCAETRTTVGGFAPRDIVLFDNGLLPYEECFRTEAGLHTFVFLPYDAFDKISPIQDTLQVSIEEGETKRLIFLYREVTPDVVVPEQALEPAVVTLVTASINTNGTPPNSGLRWDGQAVNRSTYLVDTTMPSHELSFVMNVGWLQKSPASDTVIRFDDLVPGEHRTVTIYYEKVEGPTLIEVRDQFNNSMIVFHWIDGQGTFYSSAFEVSPRDGHTLTFPEVNGFTPEPIDTSTLQPNTTFTVIYQLEGVANVCLPVETMSGNPLIDVSRRWNESGYSDSDTCKALTTTERNTAYISYWSPACRTQEKFQIEKDVLEVNQTYTFTVRCFPTSESVRVIARTEIASGHISVKGSDDTLYPFGWSFSPEEPAIGYAPKDFQGFVFGDVDGVETPEMFPPSYTMTSGAVFGLGCYNPSQYRPILAYGVNADDRAQRMDVDITMTQLGVEKTMHQGWELMPAQCATVGREVTVEFADRGWGGWTPPPTQWVTITEPVTVVVGEYTGQKSLSVKIVSHEGIPVATWGLLKRFTISGHEETLVDVNAGGRSSEFYRSINPGEMVNIEFTDIHGFRPLPMISVRFDQMLGPNYSAARREYVVFVTLEPITADSLVLQCVRVFNEYHENITESIYYPDFSGELANVWPEESGLQCMYVLKSGDYVVSSQTPNNGYFWPTPYFLRPGMYQYLPLMRTAEGWAVRVIDREVVPRDRAYVLCLGVTSGQNVVTVDYNNGTEIFRGIVRDNDEERQGQCMVLDMTRTYRIKALERPGYIFTVWSGTYQWQSTNQLRLSP